MRKEMIFVNPIAECLPVLLWFCGIGRGDGKIVQSTQRHNFGS
jgi:hypothetical protein